MKYSNPIIPGFHPDPSVCRVGKDYYLVTSSFEYFPGVPIFHSKDLINWTRIGHCLTRESQLKISSWAQNRAGIYAPTIRYHDGVFYMITTNVGGGGNFYVTALDPAGEWSEPIWLQSPGIDPSLFFDDDGSCWYTGTGDPAAIYLQKLDLENGRLTGEKHMIWQGTGGAYPEGPHIYKKDGWYYLLISEGGTERCHMITMARSKKIEGPYEPCPYNPVMTNRSLPEELQSIGHADLFDDGDGHYWAVCLGTRCFGYPPRHNLGRETMLAPVDWMSDWPVFGESGAVKKQIETDKPPVCFASEQKKDYSWSDDFSSESLVSEWNFLYTSDPSLFRVGGGRLTLIGNELSIDAPAPIAMAGVRQLNHKCSCEVTLTLKGTGDMEAGISLFLNNLHHYDAKLCRENGETFLAFKRRIGSLFKTEARIKYGLDSARLRMEADADNYVFLFKRENEFIEIGRGETGYLTTEVGGAFTGNYIMLFSSRLGEGEATAEFSNFEYSGKEE